MSQKPWTDWSDEELAHEAQIGMRGQGAVVEALRRHREALISQQNTTTFLSWAMVLVGIVGIVVAIALGAQHVEQL